MSLTAIAKGMLLLEELRKFDPELPANQAAALFAIAHREGIRQTDLAAQVGASKAAIQRTIDKLSDRGVAGKPGLGLIEVRPNPSDGRERQCFLSALGRRFVRAIETILGP